VIVPWLVSSALFAVAHGRWAPALLAGLAFGWVYSWRFKLGDAVVAHAMCNALVTGFAIAFGRWSLA
jgi:membrane protease YdiL (CAAX protease family)